MLVCGSCSCLVSYEILEAKKSRIALLFEHLVTIDAALRDTVFSCY
jgi:hypothetical protein